MVDHVLIDDLDLKARDFATEWKNMVRKVQNLKHYNSLNDEALISMNAPYYSNLSKTLDRGLDRSLLGNFFVNVGKTRMREGFPISEVIFAVNLSQKMIINYILTEFAPENPVRMYSSMEVVSKVSEFFLLGCFYITKGFLEAVNTHMNIDDSVSEELLKKYFRDDFFFKNE